MRCLTLSLLAAAADAAKWPLGAPHADSVPATHARRATTRGDVETRLARVCGIFTGAEPVVLSSTGCSSVLFTGAAPACREAGGVWRTRNRRGFAVRGARAPGRLAFTLLVRGPRGIRLWSVALSEAAKSCLAPEATVQVPSYWVLIAFLCGLVVGLLLRRKDGTKVEFRSQTLVQRELQGIEQETQVRPEPRLENSGKKGGKGVVWYPQLTQN